MLPTIAQTKELIASSNIELSDDGVVLKSRFNGKFVEFDSDIYSDEEARKVCMLWLKDPVFDNPEWGHALIIGRNGVFPSKPFPNQKGSILTLLISASRMYH